VVRCEAKCNNWLQIQFDEFDAVWVMEKSGDITLMDRLHDYVQQRLPNYMNHQSPMLVPSHIIELTKDELREELLKKRELKRENEERAAAEETRRKEEEKKRLEEEGGGKGKKKRETINRAVPRRRRGKSDAGERAVVEGEGQDGVVMAPAEVVAEPE
jgi:hypothetical protein